MVIIIHKIIKIIKTMHCYQTPRSGKMLHSISSIYYTFYTLRLSGTTIIPHRASILVELINTWWCWLLVASSTLNCSNTYTSYVTIIPLCGATDYICYRLYLDTLGPIISVLIIKDSLYDKTLFGTINEYVVQLLLHWIIIFMCI